MKFNEMFINLEKEKESVERDLNEAYDRVSDLEDDLDEARYEVDRLERHKECLEEEIIKARRKLNSSDPAFRYIFAKTLTSDAGVNLNGQFGFKNQYVLCNGYAVAIYNEPIEQIPFCEENDSVIKFIEEADKKKKMRIDFRTSEIEKLKSEFLGKTKTVRIGDSIYNFDYLNAIKSVLNLDDSAEYYAFEQMHESDSCKKCDSLYIVTPNDERGLILPIREPKEKK